MEVIYLMVATVFVTTFVIMTFIAAFLGDRELVRKFLVGAVLSVLWPFSLVVFVVYGIYKIWKVAL